MLSQRIIANCRGDGSATRSIATAASGGVGSGGIRDGKCASLWRLELDLVLRTAARSGKAIDLRPKEFLLLEYLVRNVNHPVTRTMILEHVWNFSFEGLTNMVDVHISSLRGKVDRDFPQTLIQTSRFTRSNAALKLHPS